MESSPFLTNLPSNQEVVDSTILVLYPNDEISFFQDFKSYLEYVGDRENHDDIN